MKFLVLIPTIRQALPGFDEIMRQIKGSFTHPTEFQVLDGREGKAQTLNRALTEWLDPSDCDVFVTMDDDYVPSPGWQDEIARGFEALPKVGVLAIWLGEEQKAYMNSEDFVNLPKVIDGLRIRMVHRGNIPGAMLAFRKPVAQRIGPTPVGAERYQSYEDSYRCERARLMGWSLAYVEMDVAPKIHAYPDPAEYLARRVADTESARINNDVYMVDLTKGIPIPFVRRVRLLLGKIKRRIFARR